MKKKYVEEPLAYWEEKSYMMVIPSAPDDNLLEKCLDNLSACKEIKVKETSSDAKGTIKVALTYDKEDYEVNFYVGGISVPEFYLYKNYLFTDKEREDLLAARQAVTIFMKFGDDAKKSYHLQLKLAVALIPDLIGVLDESAEKMIPAKWVLMAAKSSVLPSSNDLFTVQAVMHKKGYVWLHTHGLSRCNITELEILESDKENYQQHYNLISTLGMYLVDKKEGFEPRYNGAYIGHLINGYPVVATCVSWTEGILEYRKLHQGGIKDRQDGHNTKSSIIFLYKSEEDENNKVLSKVSIYDKLWGENPLFFFSTEETNRMALLARERFSYVKDNFLKNDNQILIKIGLPLKEEGQFEHIWFELLEIKGNKFKAKLTQEPYDIPDIHTGYEAWFKVEDITDWIIYTKEFSVSPSNAYLLEK